MAQISWSCKLLNYPNAAPTNIRRCFRCVDMCLVIYCFLYFIIWLKWLINAWGWIPIIFVISETFQTFSKFGTCHPYCRNAFKNTRIIQIQFTNCFFLHMCWERLESLGTPNMNDMGTHKIGKLEIKFWMGQKPLVLTIVLIKKTETEDGGLLRQIKNIE